MLLHIFVWFFLLTLFIYVCRISIRLQDKRSDLYRKIENGIIPTKLVIFCSFMTILYLLFMVVGKSYEIYLMININN